MRRALLLSAACPLLLVSCGGGGKQASLTPPVKTVTVTPSSSPSPTSTDPFRSTDGSFDAHANQACLGAELILAKVRTDPPYLGGIQIIGDGANVATGALETGQTQVHAAGLALGAETNAVKIATAIDTACKNAGYMDPLGG